MIFAGDEIGAQGAWGEDSRSPYPWNGESERDEEILQVYKDLIVLRKESHALIHGGLQWLKVEEDYLCYIRESTVERLLVLLARAEANLELDLAPLEFHSLERVIGDDVTLEGSRISIRWRAPGFVVMRMK
jgi:alpha-glucosidase